MHRLMLSTGITHFAPLRKAAAIVDVALNTSMMTTMLLLTSYKCTNAGERQVKMDGLLLMLCAKLSISLLVLGNSSRFS